MATSSPWQFQHWTRRTAVPSGGVDILAGYVADLKSKNPNNVVVSAGDLIGASPLISALFHDEGTIEAMNRLGLEFNAVGNHEFDEGKDELLRMQNGGCHANPTTPARVTSSVRPPFEGPSSRSSPRTWSTLQLGGRSFPPRHQEIWQRPRGVHWHDAQGNAHDRHAHRSG